ncbi:hypothetical protein MOX02_49870 [Methylobacterium oxalidis]|uniref:Uncharacterized protein n=1 Tax=Methylobacterium oxalidis TaxID=944322 RepID=A0A512JAP9_9HYPH|nr:hypothetical protein MOX02_49870 [Methylobacterium oxalidis]GLS64557.1 hypothetical protein GCM10007888_29380 [Methylobacterium oxalidis]
MEPQSCPKAGAQRDVLIRTIKSSFCGSGSARPESQQAARFRVGDRNSVADLPNHHIPVLINEALDVAGADIGRHEADDAGAPAPMAPEATVMMVAKAAEAAVMAKATAAAETTAAEAAGGRLGGTQSGNTNHESGGQNTN